MKSYFIFVCILFLSVYACARKKDGAKKTDEVEFNAELAYLFGSGRNYGCEEEVLIERLL